MGKLFDELKRRKVFRVAAVYAVVAWLLIQIADVVLPTFGAPDWVGQTIIFLFVLGFLPTMIAAWAYEITPQGIRPDSASATQAAPIPSSDRKLIYATFGLVLLVAGFQVSDRFLSGSELAGPADAEARPGSGLTRLSVNIPQDQFFHPSRGDFDLSEDGTVFVYRGISDDDDGAPQLWLRRWDELSGRPLRDTRGATRPRISPNGEEVVFSVSGRVRVVPLGGGLSRTLTDADTDMPDWSPDGEWIYFHDAQGGISRVPAMGGEAETVTRVNADNGEAEHIAAHVLPGNRMLYMTRRSDASDLVSAINLESGESRNLASGKFPLYSATGHLLFQALDEPTLLAAPFDLETLELTGSATPLATGLLLVGTGNAANIGLSRTGRLVYRLGSNAGRPGTPMWVDRSGTASEIDPQWTVQTDFFSASLALSPGGDRLAISNIRTNNAHDLWVKRLDSGPLSRVTFTDLANRNPAWSTDGQSLIYSAGNIGSDSAVWTKRADGSGGAEILLELPGLSVGEVSYSPDGRWLVYRTRATGASVFSGDVYALDTSMDSEPLPLLVGEYYTHSASVSPDGQWLTYVSSESGRSEVYVRPFPDVDSGRWQVSGSGGSEPVWAHSGRELFYRNGAEQLVAVQLSDSDTFAWDSQDILFSVADYRGSDQHPAYAVSPDDQRFVMIRLGAVAGTELILVDNWTQLLE